LRRFIRKPLDGSTTGVTEAAISIWIPYICRIEQINVIADYTPILTPTLGHRHGGRMKTSAQLILAIFAATFLSNLHETSDASWRSTAIVGIPATTLGCIFIRLFFISNIENFKSAISNPRIKTLNSMCSVKIKGRFSMREICVSDLKLVSGGSTGDAIAVGGAIGGGVGITVGLSSGAVVLLYWA
jgi:hypothetical protein